MSDDGQGGGASDWQTSLPEGVQGWDEAKQSDSPEAFWDQMTNMRSRMGRSLTIPGEDAGTEDRTAFLDKVRDKVPELMLRPVADDATNMNEVYRMMGMPEKAADYKVPEFNLDGFVPDEQRQADFAALAHDANLNQTQFDKVVTAVTTKEYEQQQIHKQQFDEGLTTLASEWGAATDQNKQVAENVRSQYFPFIPEQMNADTMKAFVAIAAQLGGESNQLLHTTPGNGVMTPEDATMQLSEIMGNKEHPYWNARDMGHKAARAKVSQLTRLKLGSA